MPTQRPLLESAIESPINQHYYTGTDNIFHLAVVLAQKIMLNHSFSDGNKRNTSVAVADMFLRMNGYYLTPGDEGLALGEGSGSESNNSPGTGNRSSLADAHVAVASGQWDEEELARFYKAVVQPLE